MVYLCLGYKGFCQIVCDTVDFEAFLSVQNEKMKFLPPGYNTKDFKSKQSNKWRWGWLSVCDTNGDKWGLWLKKPDIAGSAYCECCAKSLTYAAGKVFSSYQNL